MNVTNPPITPSRRRVIRQQTAQPQQQTIICLCLPAACYAVCPPACYAACLLPAMLPACLSPVSIAAPYGRCSGVARLSVTVTEQPAGLITAHMARRCSARDCGLPRYRVTRILPALHGVSDHVLQHNIGPDSNICLVSKTAQTQDATQYVEGSTDATNIKK